jgi:hypothetical protein
MKKLTVTLLTLMLFIGGCASSVTKDIMVETDSDPKADLSGYKSYAWLGAAAIVFDEEGQWEPPQFDADAEIKFLIDRELRDHGMTEDSVNPDLVIAYAAGIDMDVMDIKIDPESEIETLENAPAGALVVIMIDADTGLAIWVGIATADIQENPTVESTKARLDYAVSKMFAELPH